MDHGDETADAAARDAATADESRSRRTPRRSGRRGERPERARRARRTRRTLAFDLTALAVIGALLIGAVGAGVGVAYRELYSPTAFVERYLSLLADGRATDARAVPGVELSTDELKKAGIAPTASDALLRSSTLSALTDVEVVGERTRDGVTDVNVSYRSGGHSGRTAFSVEQDGWIGIAPAWRFTRSPLAAIDLTVRGATRFTVNGFELDTRQIAVEGVDADPLAPVSMLVFSPGAYSISVDTPISTSPGVAVLSDAPQKSIPIELQTQPTSEFVEVVQQQVDEFLASCATQEVLQPTGCPFGYFVRNRVQGTPTWSIAENPVVTVEPDGAKWAIPRVRAVAHIDVDIRSIFDGKLYEVSEDVEFFLTGSITILPDGTASIQVSASE